MTQSTAENAGRRWEKTGWPARISARVFLAGRIQTMTLAALVSYRLRSLFIISAVALGIAALTIIIASVDGGRRKAMDVVQFFGPDAALVFGGDIMNRAVGQRMNTLSFSDARAITQSMPGIYMVVPMRAKSNVMVKAGNQNVLVPAIVGTSEGYAQAWNWPLSEGRDLSGEDVERSAKVCLLGDATARDLFGGESPIGKSIQVQDLTMLVVGRLAYRGFSPGGGSGATVDERIVMPITTLTQRFNMDRKYFRALRVKFVEPQYMDAHVENLRALLRHEHHLAPGQPDDFTIITAQEVLKFLTMITGGLVVFLGVTAGVAIVVGGFVLANLLYLSVSERRREIGLKKALGAPSWTITVQFLCEAVCLTLAGAAAGIGIGLGLGQTLARLGLLEIQLSAKIFVLALASALAIGIVFGLKPARRAAALDPIEALRGGE